MTITPDVMSSKYIEDTIDEEGRIKGRIIIEELNGIGVKIEELHSEFHCFSGNVCYEFYTDIPKVFGTDGYFFPLKRLDGMYRFYFGYGYEYVIYTLKGIGDNGKEFEVSCRLDLPGVE